MAKGFNKVTLLGNLTRDPELRTTPNGQNVASFSLAVNRTWKNANGEQQEAVDYIDCNAWGKAGEIITQYMQKGRPLLVSGRLQQRSWEQDGNKRSKVEVVVEDFNFIGDGGGSGQQGGGGNSSAPAANTPAPAKKAVKNTDDGGDDPINLDDIPF
ncbi:MAG: single-strand DNA-binding protein [Candidatus Saccharimonadales bacterium]|jgi:single-strand DNA-binding protein